jgi:uncharacterized membrane protein YfhO
MPVEATEQVPKPAAFAADEVKWTKRGVTFQYSLAENEPILLSVTYTPRWRLSVDGIRYPMYSHENLVLAILPAGRHQVQLDYGHTWVVVVGWALTVLAACYILVRVLTPLSLFGLKATRLSRGVRSGHTHPSNVQ